jgi:hypothetical protein
VTAPLPAELQLIRGGVLLGSITLDPSKFDFPWYAGFFSPSEHFAEVRPLFDRELHLLNTNTEDKHWDAWDEAWEAISQPGLRLVGPSDTDFTSDPVIHIDGTKAWWR